jgi:pyridoxamine 5'-phosphate oxidase
MALLLEGHLDPDPLAQFRRWHSAAGVDAMAVATAGEDGAPSARMVLLRAMDERGFVFYTNLTSAKAADLAANPRVALLFHWPPTRQVRVVGSAARTSRDEDEAYFASRPRGSQLAAWASPQSSVIAERAALDERLDELEEFFGDEEIACPQDWGGYRVVPAEYEFWQQQEHRMHDRLRYRREDGAWRIERLAP